MASAHIEVNGVATRHNVQLRKFVDDLRAVQNDAVRLKEVFDQAALDGDWAALAALLGLADTTKAETVYNLIAAVKTTLKSANVDAVLGRLG